MQVDKCLKKFLRRFETFGDVLRVCKNKMAIIFKQWGTFFFSLVTFCDRGTPPYFKNVSRETLVDRKNIIKNTLRRSKTCKDVQRLLKNPYNTRLLVSMSHINSSATFKRRVF